MDPAIVNQWLGIAGAVMAVGISGIGSAIGIGAAGGAAVGAWKKCFAQGKPAPFILLSYVGAALTQTLYGMVLMQTIIKRVTDLEKFPTPPSGIALCLIGLFAGLGIALSAVFQGRVAGAAADAHAETGKGFTNYLSVLGIIETVAIFVMVLAVLATLKI